MQNDVPLKLDIGVKQRPGIVEDSVQSIKTWRISNF